MPRGRLNLRSVFKGLFQVYSGSLIVPLLRLPFLLTTLIRCFGQLLRREHVSIFGHHANQLQTTKRFDK